MAATGSPTRQFRRSDPGRGWWPLLALLLWAWATLVPAEVAVPPVARVTDLAGVLPDETRAELEKTLAEFEARKGSQLAVLVVPTTAPEAIEQYSLRVAEAWKLGRKGVDDGVLLVVAHEDRRLRIEVGRGLEGAVPDALARRIIDERMVPSFRAGDFAAGITDGVQAVIGLVDGEPLPEPQPLDQGPTELDTRELLLPLGFLLVAGVGSALRPRFGRLPAAGVVGVAFSLVTWVMAMGLVTAVLLGALAFVASLLYSLLPPPRPGGLRHRSGGWGSGGGFGGGGGGGGFSGGGGSFGGGGSSGRW